MSSDKVIILTGISRYNALKNHAERLSNEFKQLGLDAQVVDVSVEGATNLLLEELLKGVRFVCSYQGHGMDFELTNGELLFKQFPVIYVTLLTDHPLYQPSRFSQKIDNVVVMGDEGTFCLYLKEYFPHINHFISKSVFFVEFNKNIKPYHERNIDVYFPATYDNPEDRLREIDKLDNWLKAIVYGVINYLKDNTNWTIEKALRHFLNDIDFTLNNDDFISLMSVLYHADKYIRSYFRDKCVRTLVDNGVTVSVCGEGWESFICSNPKNLIILSYDDINNDEDNIYNRSKFVLNVMPWFKTATSTRAEQAIGNGAIFITDHSEWFDKNFTDEKDIVLYSLDEIDLLPKKILNIINDTKKANTIVDNSINKAKQICLEERTIASHILEKIIEIEENSN